MNSDFNSFKPSVVPGERPGREGGRRHQNRLERARAICTAAETLYLEKGLNGVTVDDICKSAKIAKGSFYRYFSGQAAVVQALFEPLVHAVTDSLAHARATIQDAPTENTLDEVWPRLALAVNTIVQERPQTLRLYLQERRGPVSETRAPVHQLHQGIGDIMRLLWDVSLAIGTARPLDQRVVNAAALGAIEEVIWRSLDPNDPLDGPSAGAQLVTILTWGLRDSG